MVSRSKPLEAFKTLWASSNRYKVTISSALPELPNARVTEPVRDFRHCPFWAHNGEHF